MKKLITIATIAVISLNFVSCRQEDDTAEFGNTTTPTQKLSKRNAKDTIKTDTANSNVIKKPMVDPDPPVKDGTSW